MKRSSGRGWAFGCGGCAVVAVALWAVLWIAVSRQLATTGLLDHWVTAPPASLSLAEVTGGVARRISPDGLMMTRDVSWSADGRYLLYAASPQFDMAEVFSLGFKANPFNPQQNAKHMQRRMMEMMAPQLHLYDLRTHQDKLLTADWPQGLMPYGDAAISPDGRRIAVTLTDYSNLQEDTNIEYLPTTLYLGRLTAESKVEALTSLGSGSTPQWSSSGRWLLFRSAGEGKDKGGLYVVDKGKPRLLYHGEPSIWGWNESETVAYCRVYGDKPNALGRKWQLVHVSVPSGKTTTLPVKPGAAKLGPMRPFECVLNISRESSAGKTSTVDLAAMDLRDGRVRWLRQGLTFGHGRTGAILGGQAAVLRRPEIQEKTERNSAYPMYLSLRDGKLRGQPLPSATVGRCGQWWLSPDGRRLVFSSYPDQLTGLNPFSLLRETLWLVEYTRPQELLSGPGQ